MGIPVADDRAAASGGIEIDVWQTRLGVEELAVLEARCLGILGRQEQERIGQIQDAGTRQEGALVWAAVRLLLGRYLDCAGEALEFVRGPYGKPALAPTFPALHFNATYTQGFLGIAISPGAALGIDAESLERKVSSVLFRKALTTEEQGRCGEDPRHFLALWTLKEAYLKCIGTGLRVRPNKVGFDLAGPRLRKAAPGYEDIAVQCWQESFGPYCVSVIASTEEAVCVRVHELALGALLEGQG